MTKTSILVGLFMHSPQFRSSSPRTQSAYPSQAGTHVPSAHRTDLSPHCAESATQFVNFINYVVDQPINQSIE